MRRESTSLLGRTREVLRTHHYALATERAYLYWIRAFIRFHGRVHPRDLDSPAIGSFLTHLAMQRRVSPKTQNQALCALVFLYGRVLERAPGDFADFTRAPDRRRIPVVLSVAEVSRLLGAMRGIPKLAASLMYGSGLRLTETLRLRVKDVDFDRHEIVVRSGKGDKDRRTMGRAPARNHRPGASPAGSRSAILRTAWQISMRRFRGSVLPSVTEARPDQARFRSSHLSSVEGS